jgi:hypothetical protein
MVLSGDGLDGRSFVLSHKEAVPFHIRTKYSCKSTLKFFFSHGIIPFKD